MIKKILMICFCLLLSGCAQKPSTTARFSPNTLRPLNQQKIYQIVASIEAKNALDDEVQIKDYLQILVVGLDDGGATSRSDVMMSASFYPKTGQISVLSIPRDLYFVPTARTVSELKAQGVALPEEMKLSELVSLAAGKNDMVYLQRELNHLLQRSTDYYIKMDIHTFEQLVDIVGGVDMQIPEDGIYYDDPIQDLKIAIPGGLQHLNGENAIKFLRYRATYPDGDLGRVHIQQQFIQTFYRTLMGQKDRREKLLQLGMAVFRQAEKNFSLQDITAYMNQMPTTMPAALETAIVPTKPEKINGRNYLVLDEDAWAQMQQ